MTEKCQRNVRKIALETFKMNIFSKLLRQSCSSRREKLNEEKYSNFTPGKVMKRENHILP
jgi:hypothetical protein